MTTLKTFVLLFYEFFKTGLFAIGGGLATVPFLRQIAEKYTWFASSMLSDMIAVSESTPGPIGINMATYAGYSAGYWSHGIVSGITGGVIATLGLITPSIIIILIISRVYRKFKENPLVANAFYTIRPAVTGMIAAVAVTLISDALLSGSPTLDISKLCEVLKLKSIVLFAVFLVVMNIKKLKKLHPIWFIITAGVCGALFSM